MGGLPRKYKCHLCAYASIYASGLKTHIRSHSGEKPFPCELCSHRSTTKGNLKIHMRTHLKEQLQYQQQSSADRPVYVCPKCSYGCKDLTTFKGHMKSQHNIDYNPTIAKRMVGPLTQAPQSTFPVRAASSSQNAEHQELEGNQDPSENRPSGHASFYSQQYRQDWQ